MNDPGTNAPPGGDAPSLSCHPLEVRPNCWMVGRRNSASLLQCNTYLRTFDEGPTPLRLCLDPGSRVDFPYVEHNLRMLIGDLSQVGAFTLNHQDPDVVGNAPYLCLANPRVDLIVTEEVWRLVQHLDFHPGHVQFANPRQSSWVKTAGRGQLQLVPTPFCHFRGAMAFYDPELRVLFTGDLLGGLNRLGSVHLFAEEDDWTGIAQFHQIYMPTRDVLRYAIAQIRALRPAVEVIAPQHGHVIVGDCVPAFLERMHELLVGHDLLATELDDSYLPGYQEVFAELAAWAADTMSPSHVRERLTNPELDDGLEELVQDDGRQVTLRREGYAALAKAFARLTQDEPFSFANAMRSHILELCTQRGLPVPTIGVGLEEGGG